MEPVDRHSLDGIATLIIRRGKVNALNGPTVTSLRRAFEDAERDQNTRAVILTGAGKFFSFGFDVPELFALTPEAFTSFVTGFTALYRYMFLFPKPILAAINGHAVAGGCMLALACDYRLMTSDAGTIGLNEVSFGATVFAGSVEMLRFCVGSAAASEILLGGALYSAADALRLGLVHEAVPGPALEASAGRIAARLAA
jgi:Delta3-Delta2-enoyl-CoA isomerase